MPSALVAMRAGVIALGLPLLGAAGDIQRPAIPWERALEGDVYGSAVAGDTVVLLTLDPRAPHWTIEAHDARSGTLRWRRAAPGTSLGPGVGCSIILGGRDGIRALDAASAPSAGTSLARSSRRTRTTARSAASRRPRCSTGSACTRPTTSRVPRRRTRSVRAPSTV